MSYDVAAEPTGVQWRQCSYFRHPRAQWMRPGSSYTTMLLLLSLLAFNDDNVLASDVPEPNGWGQDRHVSRSTYNTMLLLQQTYGPSGCYQVQTSRSTSRESGWSPQSTMFLLQTSGGRTFCCRSLRWRQFALMLQR